MSAREEGLAVGAGHARELLVDLLDDLLRQRRVMEVLRERLPVVDRPPDEIDERLALRGVLLLLVEDPQVFPATLEGDSDPGDVEIRNIGARGEPERDLPILGPALRDCSAGSDETELATR